MARAYKVPMLAENLPVPPDPRIWAEATTLATSGMKTTASPDERMMMLIPLSDCLDKFMIAGSITQPLIYKRWEGRFENP